MSEPDIVTTLRRESFYVPTSRLNSFGMPQLGFELTSFNLIAADEIERLRRELYGARFAYSLASSDRDRMRSERNEARRRYCFAMAEHGEEAEARQTAEEEGWACFKENTE